MAPLEARSCRRHECGTHEVKDSGGTGKKASAAAGWQVIGMSVSALAVAWVVWQLWDEWPNVVHIFANGSASAFLVGFALTAISAYATVGPFWILLRRNGAAGAGFAVAAHIYFVSQLLKHLPGRVWGIGYQAARGKRWSSLSGWVGVNLIHMALATYVALALSSVVVATSCSPAVGALTAFCLALLYASIIPAVRAVHRRWENAPRLRRLDQFVRSLGHVGFEDWAGIGLLFLLGGVFQYLAWIAFGSATGLLVPEHAIHLCALYMLAWFVGWVSLVTPSGLGVREAAFVWLAAGQEAEVVAAMAVIGRLSLSVADIFLGIAHARSPSGQASA